jgi:hypothetical protein
MLGGRMWLSFCLNINKLRGKIGKPILPHWQLLTAKYCRLLCKGIKPTRPENNTFPQPEVHPAIMVIRPYKSTPYLFVPFSIFHLGQGGGGNLEIDLNPWVAELFHRRIADQINSF